MHTSTKNNLLIAMCYAGILALGMAVGPKLEHESAGSKKTHLLSLFRDGSSDKVEQILEIVKDNYVDPVKVDTLQNLAIDEVLSHLDPHSSYLPPIKARDQSQSLEGNYYGIGIEYLIVNDTILVSAVKHGPAKKAGIGPGDKILKIDKHTIAGTGVTSQQIVSLIKGRLGTSVELMLKKRQSSTPQSVSVKRDKIIVSSIDAAYMLTPTVGYIKISKFGARTDDDFVTEVTRLQGHKMNSLILDLRHNGGGYLSAATALADEFLPEKKLIVYTKGEHEPRTDYFATNNGKFEQGRLIVLVDETTASASEVVAGAVQDLDRGIVIGRRSFGKGLVQEQFNFGDGSALNLTIARYYTPLGRSIQRPYKMKPEEYFSETSSRLKGNELNPDGTIKDSLYDKRHRYKTVSGRVLYGGGGIMPDIYIPVNNAEFNTFYYGLKGKGILSEFLFNNVISHYHPTSWQQILKGFELSAKQYDQLLSFANKQGVKASKKTKDLVRDVVNVEIKALLAKFYFGEEAYYKVQNINDSAILRSLQELKTL